LKFLNKENTIINIVNLKKNTDEQTNIYNIIEYYLTSLKYQNIVNNMSNYLEYYNKNINSTEIIQLVNDEKIRQNEFLENKYKQTLFDYINLNNKIQKLCAPIIKHNVIPDKKNLIIISIQQNNNILNVLNNINNKWKEINSQDSTFLPKLNIIFNNKFDLKEFDSQEKLVQYINNNWKIHYNKIELNMEEKVFLQKNLSLIKDSTEKLLLNTLNIYSQYKNDYNKVQTLKAYIKENNKITDNKSFKKVNKLYQIKQDLIDESFSLSFNYYKLINIFSNLKNNIYSSNQKNCKNQNILSDNIGKNRLTNAPSGYFTINLATFPSFKNANIFIKNKKIKKYATAYSIDYNDKKIKVIYGIYKNKKEAIKKLTSLNEGLKINKPYIDNIKKHQLLYIKYNDK
jgi:adhesin transport system outer membrane protein